MFTRDVGHRTPERLVLVEEEVVDLAYLLSRLIVDLVARVPP